MVTTALNREIDVRPKFFPENFSSQILPGTFEHAISESVTNHLFLFASVAVFKNDETGALAYYPVAQLKIVLFGYSMGLTSSRTLEEACHDESNKWTGLSSVASRFRSDFFQSVVSSHKPPPRHA